VLWVWILVAIVAVLVLVVIVLYNRLVQLRNRTENAWAQVDVQLRRRYDLIPNLVETVKGYASHERATFEEVTKARTAAQEARTVPEQAQAENILTEAIGRLFAVAEQSAAGSVERRGCAPGRARRRRRTALQLPRAHRRGAGREQQAVHGLQDRRSRHGPCARLVRPGGSPAAPRRGDSARDCGRIPPLVGH
jgi:hypothetical protein